MLFGYELLIILLMLGINAIFAAYEIALASITDARIADLINKKRKGAITAAFMKNRMEASLAIVQLGITLVCAIAAAVGGAGAGEDFAPYLQNSWGLSKMLAQIIALICIIIPLTLVTIVFAELVPKMLALKNKEWVVLKLSPVMKSIMDIAYPVIAVLETLVKKVVRLMSFKRDSDVLDEKTHSLHELEAAVLLARASRLIGAREEKIVLSAAQLSKRSIQDIMIPSADIFMINKEDSLMDALLKAHLDMHTRFPVCNLKNDPQTISGYVNFKDIVMAIKNNPSSPTIQGIMRPILGFDKKMTISQVLEEMIHEKAHICTITSKKTHVIGMVTLEDILEELVGEIEDEFDRSLTHIQPYGSSWIMGGGVSMVKVASVLGLDWSEKYSDLKPPTLSEWCSEKIGREIVGGELIESDSIRVVPRKFRRKKMSEAVVSVSEQESNFPDNQ